MTNQKTPLTLEEQVRILRNRSKTIAVILLIVSSYAITTTYLLENSKGKADYYVCNYNIGLALEKTGKPTVWQCTNATEYYKATAACYYQGTSTPP